MSSRPLASDPCVMVRDAGPMRLAGSRQVAELWLAWRLRLRHAPLVTSLMLGLLSLPLCLACALLLDVPVARRALRASPDIRHVAQLFSDFGLSGYMLILSALIAGAAYAALRRGRFAVRGPVLEAIAERALFVFASVALSGIAVQILKHLVGRARPGLMERFGAFHFDFFSIKASLASFPSGHSTSIFTLAAAIGLIGPRLRVPLFGFAILVGLARVVLAAHYASDILAGAMLGIVITLGVATFFARRSIAFTSVRGVLRLKGRGMILSELLVRKGA